MFSNRRASVRSKIGAATSSLLASATKLATRGSKKELKVHTNYSVVKKKDINTLLEEMGKDGWSGDLMVPNEGTNESLIYFDGKEIKTLPHGFVYVTVRLTPSTITMKIPPSSASPPPVAQQQATTKADLEHTHDSVRSGDPNIGRGSLVTPDLRPVNPQGSSYTSPEEFMEALKKTATSVSDIAEIGRAHV